MVEQGACREVESRVEVGLSCNNCRIYPVTGNNKETWLIGVSATCCLLSKPKVSMTSLCLQQPPIAVPAKAKADTTNESVQSCSFLLGNSNDCSITLLSSQDFPAQPLFYPVWRYSVLVHCYTTVVHLKGLSKMASLSTESLLLPT